MLVEERIQHLKGKENLEQDGANESAHWTREGHGHNEGLSKYQIPTHRRFNDFNVLIKNSSPTYKIYQSVTCYLCKKDGHTILACPKLELSAKLLR